VKAVNKNKLIVSMILVMSLIGFLGCTSVTPPTKPESKQPGQPSSLEQPQSTEQPSPAIETSSDLDPEIQEFNNLFSEFSVEDLEEDFPTNEDIFN
jgi:ABC-type phosphate transport system substrate-binding protein